MGEEKEITSARERGEDEEMTSARDSGEEEVTMSSRVKRKHLFVRLPLQLYRHALRRPLSRRERLLPLLWLPPLHPVSTPRNAHSCLDTTTESTAMTQYRSSVWSCGAEGNTGTATASYSLVKSSCRIP